MALEVQYNMTVDLMNPNYNVSSEFPLVQGTKPKIYLTILENGTPHSITDINHVEMAIMYYCKLDGSGTLKKLSNADITIQNGNIVITGTDITSTAGKCALLFKYSNNYITYSTPLYYYVNANPMAGI